MGLAVHEVSILERLVQSSFEPLSQSYLDHLLPRGKDFERK